MYMHTVFIQGGYWNDKLRAIKPKYAFKISSELSDINHTDKVQAAIQQCHDANENGFGLHYFQLPENSWEAISKYDSYFAGATYCTDINQFINALNFKK